MRLGERGVQPSQAGGDPVGPASVVEHTLPPHVLAASLPYHTREDEYSYVLERRVVAAAGLAIVRP
ncbi:MAG TPA: hypothetical protein VHM23_13835 [Actinomycetota bacterium]|nr:hypothetical protein [Actinomycetota bacterium]